MLPVDMGDGIHLFFGRARHQRSRFAICACPPTSKGSMDGFCDCAMRVDSDPRARTGVWPYRHSGWAQPPELVAAVNRVRCAGIDFVCGVGWGWKQARWRGCWLCLNLSRGQCAAR